MPPLPACPYEDKNPRIRTINVLVLCGISQLKEIIIIDLLINFQWLKK
jgi:hypothetical protein